MTHAVIIGGSIVLMAVTRCPLFGLVLVAYAFEQFGKVVTRG